jgi:uncharacterized protein (DUF433 family)
VFDALGPGISIEEVLDEYPYLTGKDIRA